MKKKLWFVLLFWIPLNLLSADGVAILFDNSGSMVQYFDRQTLHEAEQTAINLALKGELNEQDWEITAISPGIDKKDIPHWTKGALTYAHAFGEVVSRSDDYFKIKPEDDSPADMMEAERFFTDYFSRYLNFADNFTDIKLAQLLCWNKVATSLGNAGKSYFMYIILVTDGIIDIRPADINAEETLLNQFIQSEGGESALLKMVNRQNNSSNIKLQIQLIRVGPHFIKTPPPQPQPGDTLPPPRIVLKSPSYNYKVSSEEKTIEFKWESQGNFEKFFLEIEAIDKQGKYIRKALTQPASANQTRIQIQNLKKKFKKLPPKFRWYVRGILPGNMVRNSPEAISSKRDFSFQRAGFPLGIFLILFIILLAFIAHKKGDKIINWVKNIFGKNHQPKKNNEPDEEPPPQPSKRTDENKSNQAPF